MRNYHYWKEKFEAQDLYAFNGQKEGILWLKVRAICRGKLIPKFITRYAITLTSTKAKDKNIELFNILSTRQDAIQILDNFLRDKHNELYNAIGVDVERLKSDLFKIQYYAWGGDQNNSLDKYLVSHYVKNISRYDDLINKRNDIAANAWNYVQTSWYNNWTSYLIESLFKNHSKVVSAVGEIKSVDFFLQDIPIDLKVTYFPSQYFAAKIQEKLGATEKTWLKRQAKVKGINLCDDLSDSQSIRELQERLRTIGAVDVLKQWNDYWKSVIEDAVNNKVELIKWLYENQGEMRFGAENRIFLILIDATDMEASWQMKRAFDAIEPAVNSYLNDFEIKKLQDTQFSFKGKSYNTLADCIFVVRT